MDVKLNFINQSDASSANVVVFQKNLASRSSHNAIAWLVIENSTPGSNYPFVYSYTPEINATDSYGNATPMMQANTGQLYRVYATPDGNQISSVAPTVNQASIQIHNDLQIGNIDANVYRNDKLVASKTGIAPQQKAIFQFKPTLWIGVVSQVDQGQLINQAILSDVITQISLLGITSADIVMTGGGNGANATPFTFNLSNIVYTPGV
jgi:hypothetical protein